MLIATLIILLLVSLLAVAVLFFRYRQIRQLHANSVRLCHRVANEFSQRKEHQSVVERMFKLVVSHTHAEMALLTYRDQRDGGAVSVLQVHGIQANVLKPGTPLAPGKIGYGFGVMEISEVVALYHEQLQEAVLAATGVQLSTRQNMMCLPIVSNDTVHGMLQLISAPGRAYSERYLSDLSGLGVYMDAAIQNAARTSDIRRERDAAQALFNIGLRISSFGELDDILNNAVRETHRLLKSDFSWYLELTDPEDDCVVVRSCAGKYGSDIVPGLTIPLKGRTAALVDLVRKRHRALYLLIKDLEKNLGEGPQGYTPQPGDDRFCDTDIHEKLKALDVRSAIIVPVGGNGIPRGLLCSFKSRTCYFDSFEVMLQRRIANQLLIAINTADIHNKIRQLALAEERQRISNELHDDMAQVINGLSLELHSFTKMVEKNADRKVLINRLDSIRPLLEQAQTAIREGISELRIPDGRNLAEVLADVVTRFERSHDFVVHAEFPNERLMLPRRVQRELLRITQEALLNVAKHSGTSEAWLRLRHHPPGDGCMLEISDRGRRLENASIEAGQGITTMYDRARRINATVDFLIAETGGLTVSIMVPDNGH